MAEKIAVRISHFYAINLLRSPTRSYAINLLCSPILSYAMFRSNFPMWTIKTSPSKSLSTALIKFTALNNTARTMHRLFVPVHNPHKTSSMRHLRTFQSTSIDFYILTTLFQQMNLYSVKFNEKMSLVAKYIWICKLVVLNFLVFAWRNLKENKKSVRKSLILDDGGSTHLWNVGRQ
jgi:hypothetical protein